jgi:hypothetical protein
LSEKLTNLGNELSRRERFIDIGVGPELKSLELGPVPGPGRHHEDGDVFPSRIEAEELEQLEAVEVRHHEVEEQESGWILENPRKRGSTVGIGLDVVSLALEDRGEQFDHVRLVIDDVDSIHSELQTVADCSG